MTKSMIGNRRQQYLGHLILHAASPTQLTTHILDSVLQEYEDQIRQPFFPSLHAQGSNAPSTVIYTEPPLYTIIGIFAISD